MTVKLHVMRYSNCLVLNVDIFISTFTAQCITCCCVPNLLPGGMECVRIFSSYYPSISELSSWLGVCSKKQQISMIKNDRDMRASWELDGIVLVL